MTEVEVGGVETGGAVLDVAGMAAVVFAGVVGAVLLTSAVVPGGVFTGDLHDAERAMAVSVAPATATLARLRNCRLENLVILSATFLGLFSFFSFFI